MAGSRICLRGVLVNGNGIYCVQHNEHAKHANARGVWGHAPQENLKNQILRDQI